MSLQSQIPSPRPKLPLLTGALLFSLFLSPGASEARAHPPGSKNKAPRACSLVRHDAVTSYLKLIDKYPDVIAYPGNHTQGEIEIITDEARIRAVEKELFVRYRTLFGADFAQAASLTGLISEDPFVLGLREAVIFPNGKRGLYNRTLSRSRLGNHAPGAVCLPITSDNKIFLAREFRHQERAWRLGLLGGFRDEGETDEQATVREVKEEAGVDIKDVQRLGEIELNGELVPLFVARVASETVARQPDEGEALGKVLQVKADALSAILTEGKFCEEAGRCYFLQGSLGNAYALLTRFLASQGGL